jgi:TorA maturation chaperone TorD
MSDPMCTPTPSDPSAAEARGRIYGLFAGAWRYPDEWLVERLLRSKALDFECDRLRSNAAGEALEGLRNWRARIGNGSGYVLKELAGAHARLFGHSVRGTCPPYELEYGRGEIIQQTAELADLAGFYAAFGLNLSESAFERADHVSVECEFMCVLCAKEAWGHEKGNRELVESCHDAQRQFLRDHLARWLPAFAHRVASLDPDGFHGHVGMLAGSFVEEECRVFDLEAGPPWLELRPIDPARDAEIDCDTGGCAVSGAGELVQIGLESLSGSSN